MKITIGGSPKEIAALVFAVQERQFDIDVEKICKGFTDCASSVIQANYGTVQAI
jgi:hypothetical protein